jgi:hypothetical protein
MTWGGSELFFDSNGNPVFPREVAQVELAIWKNIVDYVRNTGEGNLVEESVEPARFLQ